MRFKTNLATLDALSPLKVLSRGYSVAEKDGKILKSSKDISVGDKFTLKLKDGSLNCIVDTKGE